ncbi:FG-GAP-like repeat-containing protein [Leptospira dzoumogneensis]|uniref:VCBS repeat-containing protein n=1 Tax=Leptospira dzoumogneensis TaxID=2484904 RepID=A0A4Z1ACD1_9LEPT|nr:FG-GAP-like repeat-containing protein [Leptospira dzoumogneensis]TGM98480.1 hypothetical protein EHR06_11115 [Leptospira dzoumogneensis]
MLLGKFYLHFFKLVFLSRSFLLCFLILFSFCKVETYNPAIPYSRAWWETTFLCFATGECNQSSVVVSNIPSGGLLETGFLVGTSESEVEVSIDGGAFLPATGVATWSFPLPTGSSVWKHKSIHSIHARNVGSVFGVVLSVRKGFNRDINGDGYPDLVVGSPSANSNTGEISIFHNTPKIGIEAVSSGEANTTISGTSASDYFGGSFQVGDINADGYADLVVGSEGYSTSAGRVYVFHSAGTTGITGSTSSANTTITGPSVSSQFGHVVALGDPDQNGFLDLAVGSPGYPSNTGTVYIYKSTVDGITDGAGGTSLGISNAFSTITGLSSSNNNFGSGVVFGDFNGNGSSDLAVGGSLCDGQRGTVWIFLSAGASGINVPNSLYSDAYTTIAGGYYFSRFGESLASDDLNSDGFEDLAVGGTGFPSNGSGPTYAGKLSFFYGSISAITATDISNGAFHVYSNLPAAEYVSSSITFGNINGDAFPDLIFGAKGFNSNIGQAFIIYGPASGVTGFLITGTAVIPNIAGDPGQTSQFGTGAQTIDLNLDGKSELIISAPNYSGGGKVYIFNGSSSQISAIDVSAASSTITGNAGFGGSF